MFAVDRQMSTLRQYLAVENMSNKPLYQWDKYSAYPKLRLATVELETTTGHFKFVGDRDHMVGSPAYHHRRSS
jgi:hypothetical protein